MLWIVGDLQGCAHELELLLSEVRFDPARDQLWTVGDNINRGPDTVATLECLERIGAKSVLGNHEVYALAVHAGLWPRQEDTLDDFFAHPKAESWLLSFAQQPILVDLSCSYTPQGQLEARPLWLVHGGLHPDWNSLERLRNVAARINPPASPRARVEDPDVVTATRIRCCSPAGERSKFDGLPEAAPEGVAAWDTYQSGPAFIVHGHWAYRGLYRGPHSIGLDTACVFGDCLTAWSPDSDEIVQIPAHRPEP